MKSVMKLPALACLLGFLLLAGLPAPARAADLATAKAQGQVGEQLDGYVGAIGAPSPEIAALIQSVNEGRKQSYTDIAAKRGVSPSEVAKLAAQTLIGATPSGQYAQDAGGNWVKKP